MYVAQFPTATWTLDKTLTRDILKFQQETWDPPPGRASYVFVLINIIKIEQNFRSLFYHDSIIKVFCGREQSTLYRMKEKKNS